MSAPRRPQSPTNARVPRTLPSVADGIGKGPAHPSRAWGFPRLRFRSGRWKTNHYNAVFATRNGTWHQVGNIERRWRTIRADTGFDWVTPHTFRKTVATLIDRLVDSDTAARVLGHSSDAITKEFYIEKDRTTPDVTHILQSFAGKATTTKSDA